MTKRHRPKVLLIRFPTTRGPLRDALEEAVAAGAEITLTFGHYRVRLDGFDRDEIVSSTPRSPDIAAKKLRSKLRQARP